MAILQLKKVSRHFEIKSGFVAKRFQGQPDRKIKAVEGVNFSLEQNEVVGIAGESGCGKSTTCMMIAGLLPPSSGEIIYDDKRIDQMGVEDLRWYRSQVQMIFQDPYESLNPRFRVFDTVAEGPRALKLYPETEIADRTEDMLKSVGLSLEKYADRYPHELSGGERQRVGIASALVMEPRMVIADEPLSMLDVSIRAGILDLLKDLAKQRHFSCIYVSHDLSILGHIADRLMIMYLGQAMEIGPTWDVIQNPQHPYTKALINAVPVPDPRVRRPVPEIKGDISRPIDPPPGCRFQSRCPHADQTCGENFITLQSTADAHHHAACHRLKEL
ncbi:MAG: ATP-binding cassette domain-containing protein [SAR324 cluster bacterium]|nr:ATP-binding cassette domain-containing protein [SAR324 cluster bacterium]